MNGISGPRLGFWRTHSARATQHVGAQGLGAVDLTQLSACLGDLLGDRKARMQPSCACRTHGFTVSMRTSQCVAWFFLGCCTRLCVAPHGFTIKRYSSDESFSSDGAGESATATVVGAAASIMAAAAAKVLMRRQPGTPGSSTDLYTHDGAASSTSRKIGSSCETSPVKFNGYSAEDDVASDPEDYDADNCSQCSEGGEGSEDSESSDGGEDSTVPSTSARKSKSSTRGGGKLWSSAQFPEGTQGSNNWDLTNLKAAQEWVCPCKDRRNCIGQERLPVTELFEYRKHFRTTASEGLRDANRRQMEAHFDGRSKNFTRSFVVGKLGDCCAASAGLANGLSFNTWAESRADVRKDRPWHAGRCKLKLQQQSEERAHLEAYIRTLRAGYEGPKGGAAPKDKWSVPKQPISLRWKEYVKLRQDKSLPVIGSASLFEKIWREHDEIKEYGAKGHPKCEICGLLAADRARWCGRHDQAAKDNLERIDREQKQHDSEHLGERDYAEDIWIKSEHQSSQLTAFSMDAPTEHQFDVPVQQRCAYDPVKSLESAKKWSSKITGLMIAGLGMLAFVTRDGLGSGPNLSCTVLYLGLLNMVASGHAIAPVFNVLLDNTTGDNKNTTMIYFLAWLVAIDATEEASFFCMLVGHTYSRIDQSFRALICQLLSAPIWTVGMLLQHIQRFLSAYNCKACIELHSLWDWKEYFEPHIHQKFGGFATGQFGSGMHEFVLRKDSAGQVRLWLRKSSRASTWLPDDGGYLVFKSLPTGPPKLARGKTDAQWNKSTVLKTVRAWFKHMSVDPREAYRLEQEWEARFQTVPPDGDMEQLSPSQKLQWRELPRYVPTRGCNKSTADAYVASDHMENPPVNPVTGLGRSNADVQRELVAYQQRIRSSATPGQPPLFQADFLFVRPTGASLALHRVVHGACLYTATDPDLEISTTAYAHHPQSDFPGFWGHFVPQKNPEHEPGNKSSGTRFVRHHQVKRTQIVLYDVQVFQTRDPSGDGKLLRVSTDSLRALAAATPEQPAIPEQLPPSHAAQQQPQDQEPPSSEEPQQQVEPQQEQPRPQEEDEQAEVPGRAAGCKKRSARDDGSNGSEHGRSEREGAGGPSAAGGSSSETRRNDRVGMEMEIQGCDPRVCDGLCRVCPWEMCEIVADHGGTCDVKILSDGEDGEPCFDVANRYLRMPVRLGAANKRGRRG